MAKASRKLSQAMLAKRTCDSSDTTVIELITRVQVPRSHNLASSEETLAPALDWTCQVPSWTRTQN